MLKATEMSYTQDSNVYHGYLLLPIEKDEKQAWVHATFHPTHSLAMVSVAHMTKGEWKHVGTINKPLYIADSKFKPWIRFEIYYIVIQTVKESEEDQAERENF